MNLPAPKIKTVKPSDIDRLKRSISAVKSQSGLNMEELEEIRQELAAIATDASISDEVIALRADVDQLLSQNTVQGMDIYIQNYEPLNPNCVWIDTNGIDLITN